MQDCNEGIFPNWNDYRLHHSFEFWTTERTADVEFSPQSNMNFHKHFSPFFYHDNYVIAIEFKLL